MKKLYTLLFMSLSFLAFSQEQFPSFIDVTGTAEMEVIPDEIYVAISIKERNEGREPLTVDEQEQQLKEALVRLGIGLDKLSLSGANSDYIYIKWKKKRAISRTDYRLKLSTADEVVEVFEALDELKIKSGRIVKVSHSKIKDYEKDIRIQAIKDAKARADYLLNAIGQSRGKALEVYEDSNMPIRPFNTRNSDYRGAFTEAVQFLDGFGDFGGVPGGARGLLRES